MSFIKEFRAFAVKGNALDLAVGVIIGAAFGRIVDSIVKDLVMPVFNAVLGGTVDFTNKYSVLSGNVPAGAPLEAAQKAGVVLAWGNFVTILINFLLLALVIFWLIRLLGRMKTKLDAEPAPAAPPSEEVVLLREIRDSLRR